MSTKADVDKAVGALVGVLKDFDEGTVTSITVDLMQGAEHPYRGTLLEEQWGFVGVAPHAPASDPSTETKGAKRQPTGRTP